MLSAPRGESWHPPPHWSWRPYWPWDWLAQGNRKPAARTVEVRAAGPITEVGILEPTRIQGPKKKRRTGPGTRIHRWIR